MIEILSQLVMVVATASVTWFFSRRKGNAEASKTEQEAKAAQIENFDKASDVWQGLIKDLRAEIQVISLENKELKKAVTRLERAINKVGTCQYKEQCPVLNKINQDGDHE